MKNKKFMVLLEEECDSLKDFEDQVSNALSDGWELLTSGCQQNINREPRHWAHLIIKGK